MALGREGSYTGGVIAAADVRRAGDMEWAALTGISPGHPAVSGAGGGVGAKYDADINLGKRIVTTPEGQAGSASGGGVIATTEGAEAGVAQLDDWRDLFNFRGSPMPWLLLIALGILVFAQLSIKARAGAFGRQATASAALG